jgi:long-chain fatty acid transport protein
MQKKIFTLFLLISFTVPIFAGGIFTNTNQSAIWVRLMNRDASIGIDAVYFNPAGVIKLADGFHLSLNNQYIAQNKDVTNSLSSLNDGFYRGKVSAPLFPGVYAVYKKNSIAVSFGFNPIGGGGGATYDRGLPSFEMDISSLVPQLAGLSALGMNVTGYDANIYFKGTSAFLGAQLGITYALNDMFSVYVGGRYIFANNTYNGYLKDISLVANGTTTRADTWLTGTAAPAVTAVANTATGAGTSMQPLVNAIPTFTFAQAEGAMAIDHPTRLALEGGLLQLGFTQAQIDAMSMAVAQGSYFGAAANLNAEAAVLNGTAAQLGDKKVDAKQSGNGITPIVSFQFQPSENFRLAIKYEHQTKLELTNETTVDDVNMFPDGEKVRSDLPSMFSIGADFKPMSKLTLSAGFHYFWDQTADYGVKVDGEVVNNSEVIDHGDYEGGLGIEYAVTPKLDVSVGFNTSVTGVKDDFQNDITYSLNATAIGGGFTYRLSDMIGFTLAGGYGFYQDQTLHYTHPVLGDYTQNYMKDVYFIAYGIDLHF